MKIIITKHCKDRIAARNIDPKHMKQAITAGKPTARGDRYNITHAIGSHSELVLAIEVEGGKLTIITAFYRGELDNGIA